MNNNLHKMCEFARVNRCQEIYIKMTNKHTLRKSNVKYKGNEQPCIFTKDVMHRQRWSAVPTFIKIWCDCEHFYGLAVQQCADLGGVGVKTCGLLLQFQFHLQLVFLCLTLKLILLVRLHVAVVAVA